MHTRNCTRPYSFTSTVNVYAYPNVYREENNCPLRGARFQSAPGIKKLIFAGEMWFSLYCPNDNQLQRADETKHFKCCFRRRWRRSHGFLFPYTTDHIIWHLSRSEYGGACGTYTVHIICVRWLLSRERRCTFISVVHFPTGISFPTCLLQAKCSSGHSSSSEM